MLGTHNLHEILSDRESISTSMQSVLDEATESWGIKVERTEIKDVRLPVQLQRAMAAEAGKTMRLSATKGDRATNALVSFPDCRGGA